MFGGYQVGELYNRRRDLNDRFGGQRQGGISTPVGQPAIFLITGDSGTQHGYQDGWASDGVFLYYGEGQSGNMQWKSGNVAIRDHAATGKDLLLFQTLGKSRPLRFLGQFACAGWHYASAPDSNGKQRQAIVFQLAQVDSPDAIESAGFLPTPTNLSLTELRARALNAVKAPSSGTETHRKKVYRERSEAIRAYVLCRAEGTCEDCGTAAPFKTPKDVPYLEPHHIRRLSDGGPDDPRFMAALCPNCHRHIHHGAQGATRNEALLKAIRLKEATLDRKSQ